MNPQLQNILDNPAKTITEEFSIFSHSIHLYSANQIREAFEADRWIPISEYPKENPVVLRWHKIWKCPVAVKYRGAYADELDWLTGTHDHKWPNDAFEPFFMPIPTPPSK